MRITEVRCDRCPTDVTPSTDLMRRLRPSTNSTGVSGTVVRPVFRNATNRIPDSSVVPWTTSSPYVKKNTIFFANKVTTSDRSRNVSGPVDVPPIPPSEPSCKRTRPLARSIHATPSSVDVPTPTNSTDTWKVTNGSSTTISRACTLTSTSTVATLSVIPRSSPNHLSTKASTRISGSCAVPSYRPPICCIPSCRTDAARNSRSRCVTRASASTSMPRYSTRTWTTVITPTPNALSPARGAPPNSPWPSRKGTDSSTFIRSTIFPTRKLASLPSTSTRGLNSRKKPAGIPSTAPQDTFNANTSDDGTNAKTLSSIMPASAKTRVNVL